MCNSFFTRALILALSLFFAIGSSFATQNSVKLSGSFNFISAIRSQTKIDSQNKDNSNGKIKSSKNRYGLDSCANILLETETKTDNDINYGIKLALGLTSLHDSSSTINGSHIFISKDDIGKIELGSPYPASIKMGVNADSISLESFLWDSYALLSPSSNKGVEYKLYGSILNSYRTELDNIYSEPSRCISYYTPTIEGFQAGLSFIPDTLNTGGGKFSQKSGSYQKQSFILKDGSTYKTIVAPKNVLSLGLVYDYEINDSVNFRLGSMLELGKAVQKNTKHLILDESKKIEDLKAYNLGFILNYENLSFGASYYDLGNSFMSKSKEIRNESRSSTNYYSIATSYSQGPIDLSVIYYNTNHRKNILKSYTAAISYKLMPGLNSTFELTKFSGNGYSNKSIELTNKKQKTDGLIGILGLKLQF